MNEATISQRMGELAEAAVAFARERYQVSLDYSEQSVQEVERILDHLHRGLSKRWMWVLRRKTRQRRIDYYSFLWGAYLGEVMRRRWGGKWTMETTATTLPTVTLKVGDGEVFPPAKVFKRLTQGTGDNVWAYFQVAGNHLRR